MKNFCGEHQNEQARLQMSLSASVHFPENREDVHNKGKKGKEETDSLGIEMQPRDAEGRVGVLLTLPLQVKDTAADRPRCVSHTHTHTEGGAFSVAV